MVQVTKATPSLATSSSNTSVTTVQSSPQLDWPKAPSIFIPKCCIFGVWGRPDTGKSTLAMTGKSPVAYIYSNVEKADGIAEAATAKGQVVHPYYFGGFSGADDPHLRAVDYMGYLKEFRSKYIDAWSFARSIVLDTDSDVWRLICRAYHGALSPKAKHATPKDHRYQAAGDGKCLICGEEGKTGDRRANWGGPNDEWFSLFDCAKQEQRKHQRTDLILVSKCSPIYKNHKKTRLVERKGQTDVDNLCDVIVQTDMHVDPASRQNTYTSTIVKPWNNSFAQGAKVDNWDGLNTIPGIMSIVTGEFENGQIVKYGNEEVWK